MEKCTTELLWLAASTLGPHKLQNTRTPEQALWERTGGAERGGAWAYLSVAGHCRCREGPDRITVSRADSASRCLLMFLFFLLDHTRGWSQGSRKSPCSSKSLQWAKGQDLTWLWPSSFPRLPPDPTTEIFVHRVYCCFIYNGKKIEQPSCPSTDDWILKMWYMCTMNFYSEINR